MYPRSPTGAAGILPAPPWHYSGEMLTVEFRTDPANVAELLPEPLELVDDDPGASALIWADWQSCSDSFEEILDPARAQYKEAFLVVRCAFKGQVFSRAAYIWVDKDFAMARGHIQGYPKKMSEIWMTRPVAYGKAGPSAGAGRAIRRHPEHVGAADRRGPVHHPGRRRVARVRQQPPHAPQPADAGHRDGRARLA